MSNPDHLAKFLQGADAWNAWRRENPEIVPDLTGAALTERAGIPSDLLESGLDLRGVLLRDADLAGANLADAELMEACLENADLRHADLCRAALMLADLSDADLLGARLDNADLSGANLNRACLRGTDLRLTAGLTFQQIIAADTDTATQLPPYMSSPDLDEDDIEFAANEGKETPAKAKKRAANPYLILETSPGASALELRNAYLRLAKKYHPDVNPGDAEAEQRFKNINEAYRRAAAHSRAQRSVRRRHAGRRWATALCCFLIGAAAAVSAVYWLRPPAAPESREQATHSTAPTGPMAVALNSRKEPDVPDEAEHEQHADERLATGSTDPLALSISTHKDDSQDQPEPSGPGIALAERVSDPPEETPAVSPPTSASEIMNSAPKPADIQPQKLASLGEPAKPDASEERWQWLHSSTDLPALYRFIAQYSEKPAADQARQRFRALVAAVEQPGELKAFLHEIPDETAETALAQQRLARLIEKEDIENENNAWQTTKDAGSIAAFRAYLVGYPTGRHVSEARQQLAALQAEIAERKADETAWSKAQRSATRSAFQAYLNIYPDGRFAAEAKSRLSALDARTANLHKEEEAWARARAVNTRQAYANYLSAFPNGRYAAHAQQTIEEAANSPRLPTQTRNVYRPELSEDRPGSLRWPSSDEPFIERLPRSY